MNCEVLDFVAEATDAALFVEARIRQEGMQLVYSEPPEPYPVWADPARLRQVFVNLFDNAIKYSEPGGTIFLTLSRTRSRSARPSATRAAASRPTTWKRSSRSFQGEKKLGARLGYRAGRRR